MDGKGQDFFLRNLGWPYEKIEEEGIISPVISISCEYKAKTTFSDRVSIEISVKSVKLSFLYRIVNQDGILVCTTISEYSFCLKKVVLLI